MSARGVVVICLELVLGASCASAGGPRPEQFVLVPEVTIDGDGLVIEADDRAFRIVSGEPMPSPFWNYDCPAQPTLDNAELGKKLGARPVRVVRPDGKEVHGLLALCPTAPDVVPGLRRTYRIVVPDDRFAAAAAGGVSLAYQPSGFSKPYDNGFTELPTWILWLSSDPL